MAVGILKKYEAILCPHRTNITFQDGRECYCEMILFWERDRMTTNVYYCKHWDIIRVPNGLFTAGEEQEEMTE